MFFFGFFHSFAKSLPYSAASFLFFLVHCLFKRNVGIYVAGQWNKVMLNDRALVPGCWPSLFQGFLTTYWLTLSSSETKKCEDSKSSSGSQLPVHSRISQSRNVHPQCVPKLTCNFSLHFSLVYNKNVSYSPADILSCGSWHLASWESLVYCFHNWFRPHNPSTFYPEHQQQLLWPRASHKEYQVSMYCSLQ